MSFGLKRWAAAACLATIFSAAAAPLAPEQLKDHLTRAVHIAPDPSGAGSTAAIRDFYVRRDYRPLWSSESRLSPRAVAVLAALARAAEHGLNPTLYGMPALDERVRAGTAEGELALTRAYLEYTADISSGVIDRPRQVGRMYRDAKRLTPEQLLKGIAAAPDAAAYLARLPPDTHRYDALKATLARYRQIERNGGWGRIGQGPTLRHGVRSARVAEIKRRLVVTGELRGLGDTEAYDDALTAAVKANIADNELKLAENEHTVHTARIIVGQPYQQTPVFSATMTQIEINPYWNVPRSIAVNEMLPTIRRNPGYLAANGYTLPTRSGDNTSAVNPHSVDWSMVERGNFPYFIRQFPGANNALGSLLFRLPNPHNVYLHDTPAKRVFDRGARFFSHGCMRVENPMKLALLLLAGQEGWTEERINAVIATRTLRIVPLQRPIAVHVTYLTAWAERDGAVQFRRDVYQRDSTVLAAFRQATQKR
jgi:murein L,D-transpeptidase YcbB/YkuD